MIIQLLKLYIYCIYSINFNIVVINATTTLFNEENGIQLIIQIYN